MKKIEPWVVYRMTLRGKTTGMSAVCEQSEWEAMELAQPGHHTLIRAGITSEGEAEAAGEERLGGRPLGEARRIEDAAPILIRSFFTLPIPLPSS